jgi:3' terminal RNA ribose 2'-O-methyltransferase Hen1
MGVLITLSTTYAPATDLGYLLVKHPDRVQRFSVTGGVAHVFYPEASDSRCTAALLLDVDTSSLRSRQSTPDSFSLHQYVNDRPYAASSLLSAAVAKVFRTALRGESADRPALAATAIPLELRIPALRCRGGAALAEALFAPLGWTVAASPVPLDPAYPEWGASRYVDLTLTGVLRVAEALNQVYVLLPVLDDAKHYWVAPDEVEKLLRAGTGWLAGHPEKALIAKRYLAHRRALTRAALDRLAEAETRLAESDDMVVEDSIDEAPTDEDAQLPEPARRVPLAAQRRAAVRAALIESGATRVLDLGCGPGALVADLVGDRRYTEIVGVDVAAKSLALAERRLHLSRLPERQRGRIKLWQSALTYRDDRLRGYDAAVLMEVVEHIDPPRLPALEDAVFGHAAPGTVVVTTPNVEYNVRYEGLGDRLRHSDHRFEWTRAEFSAWASMVAERYGYRYRLVGVGEPDPDLGTPTQMAVFERAGSLDASRPRPAPIVSKS